MPKIATFYDHMRDIARQENCFVVDAMLRARELGVEALEASANNVLGREDEMGQELAMADMTLSSIPSYFHFERDPDVKRQAAPLLEAAQFLGAPRLLVIPGFVEEGASPQQREDQTLRMMEGVQKLSQLAGEYGVSLVMEEYDDRRAPFASAREVRRFLDACPALGCAFDTGNFRFAGDELPQAYQLLRDRVEHVHLKDRAFSPLAGEEPSFALDGTALYPAPVGGGDLPLEEAVARLVQDGYDGIYTIEHYGAARPWEYLAQSVSWVKFQLDL